MLEAILKDLKMLKDKGRVERTKMFLQIAPGGYGEGDQVLGVSVPNLRMFSKKYQDLNLKEVEKLLKNSIHEVRLLSLYILTSNLDKYLKILDKTICVKLKNNNSKSSLKAEKEAENNIKKIIEIYLTNIKKYVNNWDLVDSSASQILGKFLYFQHMQKGADFSLLFKLSKSENLWEKRVGVVATHYLIKQNILDIPIQICQDLLNETHPLMHKAVGWTLREIGKKDISKLRKFLDTYVFKMPRIMLNYAVEKMDESERQKYLKMK